MAMKRLTPEGGHDQTETTGQPPRSVQRLTEPEINLGVRQEVVQIAVDEAFEANKTEK
jgi:hypothetical protein